MMSLGLVFPGEGGQLVVIDCLGVAANTIAYHIVHLARKGHRRAVRKMPAVREIHSEDSVARLEHGEKHAHVGLAARMRLDIGMVGAEKKLCPVTGKIFRHVDEFATAIVPLAGITLGVLVGEHGARRFHDRLRSIVFAGDELELVALARRLGLHGRPKFRIELCYAGHHSSLSRVIHLYSRFRLRARKNACRHALVAQY